MKEPSRDDFPALGREIDGRALSYLVNGATTLKPRSVIRAVCGYYESNGANIHRGSTGSPRRRPTRTSPPAR
ncbi:hypothetical protein [Streptomyces sp. OR43]|uniref:hypothetical protein n=1 Tax=Streptomyces sp. or43 TaxID=2478957 RepID=UPI00165161CF|nr:hypothetical protein [Streptomyces sp. or43]